MIPQLPQRARQVAAVWWPAAARRRGSDGAGPNRARGERGAALIAVLFVIAMTFLIIVALIGMSLATTGLASTEDLASRRGRAAEQALQAVINQISRDQTGNLGFPPNYGMLPDCTVAGGAGPDVGQAYTDGLPKDIDVVVECESLPPLSGRTSLVGVADSPDSQFDLAGVKILGQEYLGDQSNWMNWSWWPAAVGAPGAATLPGTKASLVHQGPGPLAFAANVEVRSTAAGVRTDDPDAFTPLDSAVGVTGSYTQGAVGIVNDVDPASAQGDPTATCGALTNPHPDLATAGYGAVVQSGGGITCSDLRADRLSWRSTGVTTAPPALPSRMPRQPVSPSCEADKHMDFQPGLYDSASVRNLNHLFKTCNDTYFHFKAGDYYFDADASAGVGNALVFDNPSIRVLFGTAVGDEADNAIPSRKAFPQVCAGASYATSVGAPPTSSTTTTAPPVPGAEVPATGAAVMLSPRTSIRHIAGRVAVCGRNGPSSLAIWQADSTNLGWQPASVDYGADAWDGGGPGVAAPGDGLYSRRVYRSDCNVFTYVFTSCGTQYKMPRIVLEDFYCVDEERVLSPLDPNHCDDTDTDDGVVTGGDPGGTPLSSVQIMMKAQQTNGEADASGVYGFVYPKGSNQPLCWTEMGELPTDMNDMVAYELLQGACKSLLVSRSQLKGARIEVEFKIRCALCDTELLVDYVGVRVPWVASGDAPGGVWSYTNPSGWLVANDGQSGRGMTSCGNPSEWWPPSEWDNWLFECDPDTNPVSKQFGLRNLSDRVDPLAVAGGVDPDIETAGIVIKGSNSSVNRGPRCSIDKGTCRPSSLTVRVQLGGTNDFCQFTQPNFAPYREMPLYVNLLQGNCATKLTKMRHLVSSDGKEARVDVTTTLHRNCTYLAWFSVIPLDGWGACGGDWGATIDYLGVSATAKKPEFPDGGDIGDVNANTYHGAPLPFLVTSNAAELDQEGTGADAVFGVFGRVELPRSDLDIHWNGRPAAYTVDVPEPGSRAIAPIFNGRTGTALVVNGIGSSADVDAAGNPTATTNGSVGVVCCGPAKPSSRRVKLTARLRFPGDGPFDPKQVLAVAVVRVSDQSVDPERPGVWAPGQAITVEKWTVCKPEDRFDTDDSVKDCNFTNGT